MSGATGSLPILLPKSGPDFDKPTRQFRITLPQGKGRLVAAPPLKRAPIHLRSFIEAVMAEGRRPTSDPLSFGPVNWRAGLPYDPSEPLIELKKLTGGPKTSPRIRWLLSDCSVRAK